MTYLRHEQDGDLQRLGVQFDVYYLESSLYTQGTVEETVKGLIAIAKSKPGQIAYASGGIGASTHLAGELFKSMAGVDLLHVPYKGTVPSLVDVMSGQVPVTFGTVPNTFARSWAAHSSASSPIADDGVIG